MKKIKHFIAIFARSILLLSPAIASAFWFYAAHGWVVAVLAALGVETVCGLILTLAVMVAAKLKARQG